MDFMEPITCFFQFALEEATFDPERSDHPVSGCMGERKQPRQSCSVWSSVGTIDYSFFCFSTSLIIFISHFIFKLIYCRLTVQTNRALEGSQLCIKTTPSMYYITLPILCKTPCYIFYINS